MQLSYGPMYMYVLYVGRHIEMVAILDILLGLFTQEYFPYDLTYQTCKLWYHSDHFTRSFDVIIEYMVPPMVAILKWSPYLN